MQVSVHCTHYCATCPLFVFHVVSLSGSAVTVDAILGLPGSDSSGLPHGAEVPHCAGAVGVGLSANPVLPHCVERPACFRGVVSHWRPGVLG